MHEYDPKKIESKWQKEWEKSGVYQTRESSNKPKFYILDMFPYVSGEGIHVGHPKGYIATDIVSRMKRMQGFNVLHPMGFDAFGLPAENYAIKTKTNPVIAVAKNIKRYKEQLEMIGFDYDWSREVNTSDPKFYKWTQWIFLKLLEKGLAYESNEPVNWCPVDKTILANEDVEDGKCERCGTVVEKRPIRQWVLKITDYADRLLEDLEELDWPKSIKESQKNWIGRSEGAEIEFKLASSSKKLEAIKVFTTRPDTIFGATYIVLAPEHFLVWKFKSEIENWNAVEQYIEKTKSKTDIDRSSEGKEKTGVVLKGIKAINPANTQEIPVYIADYVLPHYGTGAIMAVPAHDERDFEFAKKHELPIKQVVGPIFENTTEEGKIKNKLPIVERNSIMAIVKHWAEDKYIGLRYKNVDWRTFITGGPEGGQDMLEGAITEITQETGYLHPKFIKNLNRVHSKFFHIPKNINRFAHFTTFYFELQDGDRQEVSEEEKQIHEVEWLTKDEMTDFLSPRAHKYIWDSLFGNAVYEGEGILTNSGEFDGLESVEAREKITKKFGKKITKYKLRDWVFSRQRYWGEPIPVLRDGDKVVPLDEKDLPLTLPAVESYEPTGTEESPLANISNWINVKVGNRVLRRESNTMPQWAGSSWYYLRYMDPTNDKVLVDKKREKYWNTVDLYVGGAEHATRHLIYARFWHKFLYDIGVVSTKEPFKRLQHVGLIIAEDGRKMSKRWGNIINPDAIIDTFGADTLRMYEMFMGPFDQSVSWSNESIVGIRRFLERIWRLKEKVVLNHEIEPKYEMHRVIKKVTEDIETMNFNTAISALMIYSNALEKHGKIMQEEYKILLKLLAPFAPHMTEELWSQLGHTSSIHIESWPTYDPSKLLKDEIILAIQINGKVRASLTARRGQNEEEIKTTTLSMPEVKKWLNGKEPKKVIVVPNRIISIVT